eukprot:comp20446_c0_seq1/m.26000 comp20446_c0_seq1/g.26000  ORF comp20446_c0_seq1/g.26000 comp20446_c0_seq1/m.26000 type:complete len:691 (-) comp20446_c0_seq1:81-2153(-)
MPSHNVLPTNLPQLQNLIKRDKESYTEEFLQQLRHFESSLQIFQLNPQSESKEFGELINFLSHVCNLFPQHSKHFPQQLMDLLETHASVMQPEIRRDLCKSIILLRGKDMVAPVKVYEVFFKLFRIKDKTLREMLRTHVISDIRRLNAKTKSNALNKTLQNFMYTMVSDDNPTAAHLSVRVLVDLYRKGAWKDQRTVNVLATACFSPHTKVMVAAIQFFLGIDEEGGNEDSDNEEENKPNMAEIRNALNINKNSKKRERQLSRAKDAIKKAEKREKSKEGQGTFSALHLINDPQGLAEKLFNKLKQSTERFEVRLMMMNLISRLVGVHELVLLNFYPFLQKYIQPKQKEVTCILTYLAQACHELVPPEALEPVVLTVCNNFISERCSGEVMAVGLNTVRAICARCPLAMTPTLLQDLAQYKTYKKDKGVMMAARSLIQLYRTENPEMLARKDRGKEAGENKDFIPHRYGEVRALDYVPGAEFLKDGDEEENGEEQADGWATASEEESDSDSDGEWMDVSQDEGEGEAQEGEEEEPMDPEEAKAKARAISTQRILTPADFAAIKQAKIQAMVKPQKGGKKRSRKEMEPPTKENDEIVDPDDIMRVYKKQKMDKAARLATAEAGREGREKFGSKKNQKNAERTGGLSNDAKKKTKNFMMMIKSRQVGGKKRVPVAERKARQRMAARKQKRKG